MSRTVSPSSGKPYGLALVCRAWRASRATVYRHRAPPRTEPLRRPGPVGPIPDAELLAAIRAVLAGSPFHGEGHHPGDGMPTHSTEQWSRAMVRTPATRSRAQIL